MYVTKTRAYEVKIIIYHNVSLITLKTKIGRQEEKTELLQKIGLTFLQAKVYITLNEFGTLSAKEISKISQIDRSNIYRILSSLHSLGLAERKLSTEKDLFTVMPLKDGIELLLKRKDNEYSETQAEAKRILDSLKVERKCLLLETNDYFDLVPQGEANLKAFKKNMDKASSCIDDVITWEGFENCLTASDIVNGMTNYMKALKRGVRVRYITNFPKKRKLNSAVFKCIGKLQKVGSFEVRSIDKPPSCVFAIFDKKVAFICTFPIANPVETPVLLSNNPTLIGLTQAYFEILWLNSKCVSTCA